MEHEAIRGLQGSKVSQSWLAASEQGHSLRGHQKAGFAERNVTQLNLQSTTFFFQNIISMNLLNIKLPALLMKKLKFMLWLIICTVKKMITSSAFRLVPYRLSVHSDAHANPKWSFCRMKFWFTAQRKWGSNCISKTGSDSIRKNYKTTFLYNLLFFWLYQCADTSFLYLGCYWTVARPQAVAMLLKHDVGWKKWIFNVIKCYQCNQVFPNSLVNHLLWHEHGVNEIKKAPNHWVQTHEIVTCFRIASYCLL